MNVEIGVTLRNMGEQATAEVMLECVRLAETLGFESIWITDHMAIPPDDAEGSGGRYLETLTTLAWLAGATRTIRLGAGVLILPYRPKLPTAKQVATIQELSGGRLLLGVGIGWMDAEFRALGINRHERGRTSDAVLAFLNEAFAHEVVTLNDQDLLFRPRPAAPPIYVGGRAPHALKRAIRHGTGWLPMVSSPEKLSQPLQDFNRLCAQAGKASLPTTAMTSLLAAGEETALRWLSEYRELGLERVVCALGYQTADDYRVQLETLARVVELAQ